MSIDSTNTDHLLQVLSRHIGRNNGLTIRELVAELGCDASEVTERYVRKLVEHLRLEGHHVAAHPASGYFMAASEDELNDCCAFLFERAMTSLRQVSAMKRVSLPDLAGQLGLRI